MPELSKLPLGDCLLRDAFVEVYRTSDVRVLYARWFKLTHEPALFRTQEAFAQLFAEYSFLGLIDDLRACEHADPKLLESLQDVIAPMMRAVGLRYTALLIDDKQRLGDKHRPAAGEYFARCVHRVFY